MTIDEETGEILSFSREPPSNKKIRKVEFLDDCKDKHEVISLFRKGEHKNKILFTNYSLDYMMNTDLSKEQMQKFYKLCRMLVVRNIMIEDSKDIAEYLGVSDKNLSKLLNVFEKNHLIDYYKKNVMRRGHHIILLNPTIVWKSYLHKNARDYETNRPFCHNTFFSKVHKTAVRNWTDRMIRKYSDNTKENTSTEAQEEQAIRFGFKSLKDFDKWVNKAKKDLKLDGEKHFDGLY